MFDGDDFSWLDKEEYRFPSLKDLYLRIEEEKRRHEEALADLEKKIKEARESEQDVFNKLLTGEEEELKQAVLAALRHLEWTQVIDVDQYWKNVIRIKEEDIWLFDDGPGSVEEKLKRDRIFLVEVRIGEGNATDEDCHALQKYKGRRMQEFDNTKMKGILIGNFFCRTEAGLRQSPFSGLQVEEAERDGNSLMTTYELFRSIKAEKEGKIDKEDIRNQMKEKTGLIDLVF